MLNSVESPMVRRIATATKHFGQSVPIRLSFFVQLFQQFVRRLRIDRPTRCGQDSRETSQFRSPLIGTHGGRGKLGKLVAEQNHPQQVLEDDAFLLHQIAGADELIEVAAVSQHVADGPDGRDRQAAGVVDLVSNSIRIFWASGIG